MGTQRWLLPPMRCAHVTSMRRRTPAHAGNTTRYHHLRTWLELSQIYVPGILGTTVRDYLVILERSPLGKSKQIKMNECWLFKSHVARKL